MNLVGRNILSFKLHTPLFMSGLNVGDTIPSPSKTYDWKGTSVVEGVLFEVAGRGSLIIPWSNVQYAALAAVAIKDIPETLKVTPKVA